MLNFFISLAAFLGSHMLIARTAVKPWLVARLGIRNYLVFYSALSVALLWWLVDAARAAPRIPLWPSVHALYWLPNIMMPLAFTLLVAGFVVANPLSITPKGEGFDPQKPGLIVAITRHPVLWGFALWSSSHLVVNGEFPLAFMFLVFLVFSLAGMLLIDRKRKREIGFPGWRDMARRTHAVIFCSSAFRSGQFCLTRRDITGIVGGLFLYAVFYALHRVFFGIHPVPPL